MIFSHFQSTSHYQFLCPVVRVYICPHIFCSALTPFFVNYFQVSLLDCLLASESMNLSLCPSPNLHMLLIQLHSQTTYMYDWDRFATMSSIRDTLAITVLGLNVIV